MEIKLFANLIDALGKVADGLKAIVNLPKSERETIRRTLEAKGAGLPFWSCSSAWTTPCAFGARAKHHLEAAANFRVARGGGKSLVSGFAPCFLNCLERILNEEHNSRK